MPRLGKGLLSHFMLRIISTERSEIVFFFWNGIVSFFLFLNCFVGLWIFSVVGGNVRIIMALAAAAALA